MALMQALGGRVNSYKPGTADVVPLDRTISGEAKSSITVIVPTTSANKQMSPRAHDAALSDFTKTLTSLPRYMARKNANAANITSCLLDVLRHKNGRVFQSMNGGTLSAL